MSITNINEYEKRTFKLFNSNSNIQIKVWIWKVLHVKIIKIKNNNVQDNF